MRLALTTGEVDGPSLLDSRLSPAVCDEVVGQEDEEAEADDKYRQTDDVGRGHCGCCNLK